MISLMAHDKILEREPRLGKPSGEIFGRGTLLVLPSSCESLFTNHDALENQSLTNTVLHNWEEELSKSVSL